MIICKLQIDIFGDDWENTENYFLKLKLMLKLLKKNMIE